jgi:hypothetical protein
MRRGLRTSALAASLSLGAVPLAGCDPMPHRLEGSVASLFDLGYQQAYFDVGTDTVAVRFVRTRGEGEDVVMKMGAFVADKPLEPNVAIDLAEKLPGGGQRGSVTRNVLDDPRREFPKLARGRLEVHRLPVAGEKLRGEVSVTFELGTEAASGRTVFGNFEATVP